MRVTITCEECGERHRLERRVSEPGPIWIVCHNCELPLQAVLDGVTSPTTAPAAQPSRTPSAWAGVVDFRAWSTSLLREPRHRLVEGGGTGGLVGTGPLRGTW